MDNAGEVEDEEEEEDDEEEEPRLKYTRLTRTLGGVYRNGDAVASSLVFGERMVRLVKYNLSICTIADLEGWVIDSRNT